MMDVHKLKAVIYQDDEELHTLSIGYFAGQPYAVLIDTPDGVDRRYDGVIRAAAGEPRE